MVLAAWLLALIVIGGLFRELGANTSNNLELPGADSQEATELLADRFPPQQNGKNPIVFHAGSGKVSDPDNKRAIDRSHGAIVKLPHVVSAPSPFGQRGGAQISSDQRTAFIPVLLGIGNEEITEEIAQSFLDAAEPARRAGMKVAAGGQIGTELSEPATESSELVGMAAAMLILAFTFGTLVAMGLPILSAVFGLAIGLSLIGILGHVSEVPTIAPTLATMIGLGVGIDYALFMVSRYRRERAEGAATEAAVATAVQTSGTAIVFAGTTVVIALVTLLIAGIPLVTSLGYASAFAVITAVAAAITLLPAILALVGDRIDSLRLPTFLHPAEKPAGRGFWAAWSRFVTDRPRRAIAIAALILMPLIVPFFSLELGQEDVGATPKDTTERQAYDLMASGFGPGYNGPLLIAVDLPSPAKPSATFNKQFARAQSLQQQLEVEQQRGTEQAATLESEADTLNAQGNALKEEAAALKTEAAGLKEDKARLGESTKKLDKQRRLARRLDALVGETAALVREQAALAKQAAPIVARLRKVREAEQRATDPAVQARLRQRESELEAELDPILVEQQALRDEAASIKLRAAKLRKQGAKLGAATIELADEAAGAVLEGVGLVRARNQLQLEAANLKLEAADLEVGKAQLETLQVKAGFQQKQAEKLKSTLTADLTAAGGDKRGTDERLVALQDSLGATVGVKLVSPPEINKAGDAAVYSVIATTDPADETTAELVGTIRDYVIPQATASTDLEVHVGGQTASYVDLAAAITSKLPLVILAVIALGFLVLMMAFRSIVIPAQAALANVLAVMAAFGVVTAVFQYGWGLELVGLDAPSGTDPIASFVPLIMFAVLFGLSMDYQVFLMSWIEYNRPRHKGDREAIAAGVASGAKVIAAAALIMIAVFGSFILNGDPTVKQFGVGLSVGVALAATMVLLLAPALLVLAGKVSWWLPAWVDRHLPHLDIEGAGAVKAKAKPRGQWKPRAAPRG